MPSISIKVLKGTSEQTKHALAKALAEPATRLLKNREIFTYFDEQEFIVNGQMPELKYVQMAVSGPDLSYEDRAEVCQEFYNAMLPIIGEDTRVIFSYSTTPYEHIGINGLLLPDYRAKRNKEQGK